METEKNHLPVNCICRPTKICWMEIHLKERRKKNFESKYDLKVKSLKFKKFKNKIQFHKAHKIYKYN